MLGFTKPDWKAKVYLSLFLSQHRIWSGGTISNRAHLDSALGRARSGLPAMWSPDGPIIPRGHFLDQMRGVLVSYKTFHGPPPLEGGPLMPNRGALGL